MSNLLVAPTSHKLDGTDYKNGADLPEVSLYANLFRLESSELWFWGVFLVCFFVSSHEDLKKGLLLVVFTFISLSAFRVLFCFKNLFIHK